MRHLYQNHCMCSIQKSSRDELRLLWDLKGQNKRALGSACSFRHTVYRREAEDWEPLPSSFAFYFSSAHVNLRRATRVSLRGATLQYQLYVSVELFLVFACSCGLTTIWPLLPVCAAYWAKLAWSESFFFFIWKTSEVRDNIVCNYCCTNLRWKIFLFLSITT